MIDHRLNPVSRQTQHFVDNPVDALTILRTPQNSIYNSPLQQPAQLKVGMGSALGSLFNRTFSYYNAGNVTAITDNNNAANNQSYELRLR
jgi:hypothetical protein